MSDKKIVPLALILLLGALTRSMAAPLSFGPPKLLATLPWSNGSNHGVPAKGPEWLVVDFQGRFYLESNLDFDLFDPHGSYLRTLEPIDKTKNFFGFADMEALPDGSVALLARLESPQEQWGKDNFEERSKPGARLLVLDTGGTVTRDEEFSDSDQPHSSYDLENGGIYSIHEDGSYRYLASTTGKPPKGDSFASFAAITYTPEQWREHLRGLSVFRSGDRSYHDTRGGLHQVKGAVSYLMNRLFVEGSGPLAFRGGKIYYKVVLDKGQDFINAVFVEDPKRKNYGLVELLRADEDLDLSYGHTLFVDRKGDIFEGVGRKDGYRIYRWSAGQ